MSICGSVRRCETVPPERCKPVTTRSDSHDQHAARYSPPKRQLSLNAKGTEPRPRPACREALSLRSGGATASKQPSFSARMDGATRRACSDSGRSRSRSGGVTEPMLNAALLLAVAGLLCGLPGCAEAKECDKPCMNGQCNNATGNCVCFPGWVGDQCQHCGGRFRYGYSRDPIQMGFIGGGLILDAVSVLPLGAKSLLV